MNVILKHKKTFLFILLFVLLQVSFLTFYVPPVKGVFGPEDIVFEYGAEQTPLGQITSPTIPEPWDHVNYGQNGARIFVTDEKKHGGTKCIKFDRLSGSGSPKAQLNAWKDMDGNPINEDPVYISAWFYLPYDDWWNKLDGWSSCFDFHYKDSSDGESNLSGCKIFFREKSADGKVYLYHDLKNGGGWADTALPYDQWVHIQGYWEVDQNNGVVKLWQNNVLVYEKYNWDTATVSGGVAPYITVCEIKLYMGSGEETGFVFYMDDYVVATEKVPSGEGVKTWQWGGNTYINSVAVGNVDGDGSIEIVTGGSYYDGTRDRAQLCVWHAGTLQGVKTWYWVGGTHIFPVDAADVDGDGSNEIVTGGWYNDGARDVAQLCVWSGALSLESVVTWYWTSHTKIHSVVVGDADGDGQNEIVTGGYYDDGTRLVAQLCVWDGTTLALEGVETWCWTSHTVIESVAVGDVDGDGQTEIVTGGSYYDGTRHNAQLCVWNGSSLALEEVKTWYWTDDTKIHSVAVADVDGDGNMEIVTDGYYNDGTRSRAQLCVWNGAPLILEDVKTWYWTDDTEIFSVACADVDGDDSVEIVTGGRYDDGTRAVAQLAVWDGSTRVLEGVTIWYWVGSTRINSVAVGDVDRDGSVEIVTGGDYLDGWYVAQLCVWGFT